MQLKFTWIILWVSIVGINYAMPQCQMKCNLVYQPVCASDGQTYINACNMKKIACLLSKSIKMVHFGMCARPDDISKKQNTEMSTNLIPKEVKLTKISESEKNNLRKKSRHNQPPKFKHKQNKRQLSYLGNFALPMSTTANNILNANKKKLFASQIRNQNNYFPLKVKGFYLTNSKLPTVISQQKTTEKCTNTNPIIPEGSTPEYTGQSSTTTNPTSLECTEPESTTKEVTTSILTTPECTDLSSPTQSHTTQNINTPEYSDETKMQSTIDLTTPACTEPESTTKEVTTSILTTPECTDLPTTTESHTTQNVNTPECSDETKTHSTIDLATPECTEPESTTKEVTTSILTTPECTDLPTTTQSHTTQNIKTPECSDETKTYSTFDITTPECTEPEFTTKEVTTSILTTPECTDLPTTTQSHTTQNIKTPECSDETKTYSTFDITTPECTEPEFTTKEVTTSILTTPECTDLPTTTQSHTTQNINTPECSDEIKTHSTIDLITPKSSITEKELEYISPQPDKICNPTTPNCSNQKLTIKKHTLLHNPNQNGYNSHSTSESKPKHSNSEPTRERHGCNGCTTTESDVSSYHTRIELNQQNTAVDETKLKDVRPQIEHLSSNSIKPELCSEKSTLLRTIKCNKTETKTQSPLALHFIDRQNFSPSRYFQRQKSRFVLTHFKKRQLIRMNKLLESDMNCNLNCTNDIQPVCGSNGITYKNLCCFRKEKCLNKKNIWLVQNDKCSDFHSYELRRNLNHMKFQMNQHTSRRRIAQLSKRRKSRFWLRKSKSEIKSFVKMHHKVNNEFHAFEKHQMKQNIKARLFKSIGQRK